MKMKRFKSITVVLLAALLLLNPLSGIVVWADPITGLEEDFNDNLLTGWLGSANYGLTESSGELKIAADKANNPWASFMYNFNPVDISAHPYMSVKVKTDRDFNLDVAVVDEGNNHIYPVGEFYVTMQEIVASEYYTTYVFDFSGATGNLTRIKALNFVFNPIAPGAECTAYFDDLKLGDAAMPMPGMVTVPAQQTYINSPEQIIPLRGIRDGADGSHPVTVTASSSDIQLIPEVIADYGGGSTGFIKYTPAPGRTGTSTITVTVSAGGIETAKVILFNITVEKNKAPKVENIGTQLAKAGIPSQIRLMGIDDGNPNARQNLTVTAASSDPALIPDPVIGYTSDDRWGLLTYTPAAGQSGTAAITVTVSDDSGTEADGEDTGTMSFDVAVYPDINHVPVMDTPLDISILENEGEQTVALTGIGDGDEGVDQPLLLTAHSSNPALIDPQVIYTPGSQTGMLKFTPAANSTGESVITLTLADAGGRPDNNGDRVTVVTFKVSVRVHPIIGFADDFEDGVVDQRWTNSGEGCHFTSETTDRDNGGGTDIGVLKIDVDKYITNNQWAGLWYAIPTELDLSEHPYISIRMKTSTPPTNMLIFLWDAYDHYNTAGTVTHSVTGEYVEYYFDFRNLLKQGDGTPVDSSRIKALLINFAPGSMYRGTFYFDDLRVGDQAHRADAMYDARINGIPDFALDKNAGQQTVALTGINNGAGDGNQVTLTAASADPALIPDVSVGAVSNGNAELRFTPAPDAAGSTTISVTASAQNSNSKTITFRVDVIDKAAAVPDPITIDTDTRYQVMDGFGTFLASGQVDPATQALYMHYAKDMGMSIGRFGMIGDSLEMVNDNSNSLVTDYDSMGYNSLPIDFIKAFKEENILDKYIMSFWSPSAWMKKNKCLISQGWETNNKLEPHYYEEYAEQLVAVIKMVKERTGVDLYAISLQNEPEFNEPYASCQVSWNEYRDLIKVVGPRFRAENISTKIFMPEVLWAQGHVGNYVNAIVSDPEAAPYVDILAIHNYDTDGIHVGGASAAQWTQTYQLAQQLPNGKKAWMTETSGHPATWEGALTLAANIYTALYYGNASAWLWWSLNDAPGSEFGLTAGTEITDRYAVSKQYYKYIQPGAVRVGSVSGDADLLTVAFKDDARDGLTVVLINKGSEAKVVKVQSEDALPARFECYTTSAHRLFEKGADVTDGKVLLPPGSVATLWGVYAEEDTAAPVITLDQTGGGTVSSNPFTVSGSVSEPAVIRVNGREVALSGENTFSTVLTLSEGANLITVEAVDGAGNIGTAAITVEYAPVGLALSINREIVQMGTEVTVQITAVDAADLKGFDLSFDYNQDLFELAGISCSSGFGTQNQDAYVDYRDRDGVARIVGVSLAQGGKNGTLGLVNITLRAKRDVNGIALVKIAAGAGLSDSSAVLRTVGSVVQAATVVADPDVIKDPSPGSGSGIAINDLTAVAERFGRRTGDSGYGGGYDMNKDGVIDLFDIVYVARIILNASAG